MDAVSALERDKIVESYLVSGKTTSRPVVFAMAGNVAAGKTSLLRELQAGGTIPHQNVVLHDPDGVMEHLDGYRSLVRDQSLDEAFKRFELPAREIAELIWARAKADRRHIIIDRGCAFPEILDSLQAMKSKQGYEIRMFLVHVSTAVAKARSAARASAGQRFFPEEQIDKRSEILRALVPKFIEIADEFSIFSNETSAGPAKCMDFRAGKISFNAADSVTKSIGQFYGLLGK